MAETTGETLADVEMEVAAVTEKVNGTQPGPIQIAARPPNRRSILTQDEIDKELFANMEELEPGSYIKEVAVNNSMEGQDLIAILEGDEMETNAEKAETAVKPPALVESLMNDWSDNDDGFEVEMKSNSNNAQVVTLVPKKAPNTGASKRKTSQNTIVDTDPDSGTTTVEIIKPEPEKSPIKYERKRVIKKKVIWDPDDAAKVSVVKKGGKADDAPVKKPVERKRRRITEIDRLLADEGAINMIYELERENENEDVPEIKASKEDEQGFQVLDVDEERINLAKKAKLLKNAVIKQTTSPPTRPQRAKREIPPPAPLVSKAPTPPPKVVTTPAPPKPVVVKTSPPAKKPAASKKSNKKYENENSMIVRRRSTSSFSDPGSPRRLSDATVEDPLDMDAPLLPPPVVVPEPIESVPVPVKPVKPPKVKAEFVKPQAKKKTKPMDTSILVAQIRGKLVPSPVKIEPKKVDEAKKKIVDSKQLSIRKYDKFSYVILPSIDGKLQDCLTLQLANKIVAALKQLEADPGCQAVVFTSAGANFCTGINYHLLIQTDEEKRKSAAKEFGAAIRKFMFTLATYTKPLICGLRGEVRGIGLLILPFFDVVLASEDVRLSAPYGIIGHFPEGLSVLRLLGKIKQQTISECFMLNRKLTAEQGVAHDLVTSVVSPADFNDELLCMARIVSSNTPQAMMTIKASMTYDLREQIDEALKDEETLLIQHWTSMECQEKLRSYADRGTS